MTNGEVIMKVFPSARIKHNVDAKVVTYTLDGYVGITVGEDWWKAPYEDTDRFEDTVCVDTEKKEAKNMGNIEQYEFLREHLEMPKYSQEQEIYEKAYKEGYDKGLEVLDEIIDMIDEGRCVVENEYDKGRNYGLYIATEIINKYRTKHDDELISKLEILKSEIEWDYPLEYQVVLDEVIKKIKGEKDGKSTKM